MPRTIICAAISVLLVPACALAGAGETANLWLDVPFVAQTKDGCGAASIAMVMQYWEKQSGKSESLQADPAQILRALLNRQAHGIYASAMVAYFQHHGYRAFAFNANWSDVERELQHGRPLIVALKPGSGSSLHYVVVAGIDQPGQLVLVNDPAQRKLLKEDQAQFDREWQTAGHWTLLAVPAASLN